MHNKELKPASITNLSQHMQILAVAKQQVRQQTRCHASVKYWLKLINHNNSKRWHTAVKKKEFFCSVSFYVIDHTT